MNSPAPKIPEPLSAPSSRPAHVRQGLGTRTQGLGSHETTRTWEIAPVALARQGLHFVTLPLVLLVFCHLNPSQLSSKPRNAEHDPANSVPPRAAIPQQMTRPGSVPKSAAKARWTTRPGSKHRVAYALKPKSKTQDPPQVPRAAGVRRSKEEREGRWVTGREKAGRVGGCVQDGEGGRGREQGTPAHVHAGGPRASHQRPGRRSIRSESGRDCRPPLPAAGERRRCSTPSRVHSNQR